MSQLLERLDKFIWGPVTLLFMAGVGIYFTFRTGFFQIFNIKDIFSQTIGSAFKKKNKSDKNSISPFAATATALAGTMGTGNIVGIATALVAGGAGAIFWMWVSSFFGMMTKYAEIVLAVHFRTKNQKGENVGGPMYYIENGLGKRWLAVLFAVFCIIASFGIGNMTQVNSIVLSMNSSLNTNNLIIGIIVALFAGIALIGGVKRIAGITSAIIPFLSIFYFVGSAVALIINADKLPQAFNQIITEAFDIKAVSGGVFGYAFLNSVRLGFSRGVFSNEAGLGSAPIAHAASAQTSPVKQGMWGIFEVFLDTVVVCTITALVIITSGMLDTTYDGAGLTLASYSQSLGSFASYFLMFSIVLFAFATIIGWAYYGEKSVEYLSGNKNMILLYRCVYIACIVIGSVMSLNTVWCISDIFNGLMAIPNLIAVTVLSPVVISLTKDYKKGLSKGKSMKKSPESK